MFLNLFKEELHVRDVDAEPLEQLKNLNKYELEFIRSYFILWFDISIFY